jgi:type I restriction-modification system DNA methylase subunit
MTKGSSPNSFDSIFGSNHYDEVETSSSGPFSTGQDEDKVALQELQKLLVGSERNTINKLEGVVNGFINSVINDEKLDALVTSTVNEALNRHINSMRGDIDKEAKRLIVEAVEREITIRRGELPDEVRSPVDKAIRERIARAEKNIAAILEPVFENILKKFAEDGKKEIVEQLYPEVNRVIEQRVMEEKENVRDYVANTIDQLISEGMKSIAGQHLTEMAEQVAYQTSMRNRKTIYIAIGTCVFLLLLSIYFMLGQRTRLDNVSQKLDSLKKSASLKNVPAAANSGPINIHPNSKRAKQDLESRSISPEF